MLPNAPWLGVLATGAVPFAVKLLAGRQAKSDAAAVITYCAACDASGMTPQQLNAACERSNRASMLAGDVMQAAYATLYTEKLIALGRCLANGITDVARLDEEWLLVRALRDVEEPHVTVLQVILEQRPNVRWSEGQRPPVWSLEQLATRLPLLQKAVDPIVGLLAREGMVRAAPPPTYEDQERAGSFYTGTDFGHALLARIRSPEGG